MAGRAIFDLFNVITARAHRLSVTTLGLGILKISGSFSASPYYYFRTPRPVNFDDFDLQAARLTGASLLAYSWNWLTIFDGRPFSFPPPYLKRPLAYVRFSGWGPSIPGADVGEGVTGVLYGDGDPVGFVQADIPIEIAPEPEKVDPRVHITQKEESLVIKIDGDVLFDFDKHNIKPEAEPLLAQAGAIIRSNLRLRRVLIEGHTDAKGKPVRNAALSEDRAKATAEWLGKRAYLRGLTPEIKGWGASKAIAPNWRPDGSDDPVGRAKNRRVEIFLSYR